MSQRKISFVTSCGCEDITKLHEMINEIIKNDDNKDYDCINVQVIENILYNEKEYYTAFLSFAHWNTI